VDSIQQQIIRRAAAAGLEVSQRLVAALASYIGLLAKWSLTMNLSGFSLDPPGDEAIDRLVLEPILAAPAVARTAVVAIDVGSGGGSPALPLKLARPELRMTLVESRSRKCAFLREAIRQLELQDVYVENVRFEELAARAAVKGAADVVTVRAVRADSDLWGSIHAVLGASGQVLLFGAGFGDPESVPAGFAVHSTQVLSTSGSVITELRRVSA
jgi:16S rRNA (guanine527-N7)-methyltransferase